MGGWVDGWMGGWVDGWMDGWMGEWVGRRKEESAPPAAVSAWEPQRLI